MSVGFRHHGSGYVDPSALRKAETVLLDDVEIDHDHDVPFCAGMSEDGKTLYVDHMIYDEVEAKGYLKPLIIHEMTEHLLMDKCGLPYDEAHYLATAAEEACVKADHIDLKTYNNEWSKLIRKVASRGTFDDVPDDLDTEPYDQDDEKAEDDGKLDHGLFGKQRDDEDD